MRTEPKQHHVIDAFRKPQEDGASLQSDRMVQRDCY